MNVLLKEIWVVFVLVIISDGIAAGFAARTCYRLRRRAQLAWPLAVFMFAIALVDLNDLVNQIVNVPRPTNIVALVQATAGRTIRSAATWYLALKLMNGYSSSAGQTEDNANIAK